MPSSRGEVRRFTVLSDDRGSRPALPHAFCDAVPREPPTNALGAGEIIKESPVHLQLKAPRDGEQHTIEAQGGFIFGCHPGIRFEGSPSQHQSTAD